MAISSTGRVRGGTNILQNLKKEIANIRGDLTDGLGVAAKFIEGEAVEITPTDFGVLRNSAFSGVVRIGSRIIARVGFTAKYAAWVHEMPMTLKGQPRANFGKTREDAGFGGGSGKGNYWQGGENKFLEKAVVRNTGGILSILRRKAKR